MATRRRRNDTPHTTPDHNENDPTDREPEIVHTRMYGHNQVDERTASNPSLPVYGGGTRSSTLRPGSHPFFGLKARLGTRMLPGNVRFETRLERR